MIGICKMSASIDTHIIAYTAILINKCILNIAPMTNTYAWQAMGARMFNLNKCFEIIITHYIAVHDGSSMTNSGTDPDNAVLNTRCIDDASFCDDGFLQGCSTDLGRW